ncbi:ABC transporter permease subunit [Dactylosporangium roseum]
MALLAAFGGLLAPKDPNEQDLSNAFCSPSQACPLGTDQLGRDYLSRLLDGAHTTLGTCLLIMLIGVVVGGLLGFAAGFLGGWFDVLLMRCADMIMVFPGILLALIAVAIAGPGLKTAIIAVAISEVPPTARLARAAMLTCREQLYVDSARVAGARGGVLLVRHLVPNAIGPLLSQASLIAADAILIVAGLGYLGLGAQPPTAEWGAMLSDSQNYIDTAWYLMAAPALAILLAALMFNVIGERIRLRTAD